MNFVWNINKGKMSNGIFIYKRGKDLQINTGNFHKHCVLN